MLPVSTVGQQGPVAAWMSAAGWASAARRVVGDTWIVTPHGVVEPSDVSALGSSPSLAAPSGVSWRRRVPALAKTVVKDLREWRQARRFVIDANGPWSGCDVAFVWQRHELFHTAGLDLADAYGVPSVLFVPATKIWESSQWGVRRPGRERWLEHYGERPSLQRADLVACGSDLVAEEVIRLGAAAERVLVTPSGVDLEQFAPSDGGDVVRRRLGLEARFVVGWVGSFRPFHCLDQAVYALASLDGASLLLVGDGPERSRIERLASEAGVHTVTTGTVGHSELPAYLQAMDVGIVLSAAGQTFHYSPLKLAEYLAAGLPVVAPRVPQLSERLHDGVDALLVPPGDFQALEEALVRLRDDVELRRTLGGSARAAARERWSWDNQVKRVLDALK